MEAVLAKLADGAPVVVLLLLIIAWAAYKWPFMLLWNALQASNESREALHERTIEALNNNTTAMKAANANTEVLIQVALNGGVKPKPSPSAHGPEGG